jgi:hypothetical protein
MAARLAATVLLALGEDAWICEGDQPSPFGELARLASRRARWFASPLALLTPSGQRACGLASLSVGVGARIGDHLVGYRARPGAHRLEVDGYERSSTRSAFARQAR